jgi:AcrR family transcriptional regulator
LSIGGKQSGADASTPPADAPPPRGFHDLAIDDACADAEASKGASYVYFESKCGCS